MQSTGNEGVRAGEPREGLPQRTLTPDEKPADGLGPMDWSDLVLHTGEARGVADTAYHSLRPDAPTLEAALAAFPD